MNQSCRCPGPSSITSHVTKVVTMAIEVVATMEDSMAVATREIVAMARIGQLVKYAAR